MAYMSKAKQILARLKDPVIFLATVANIFGLLVLVGIVGKLQADEMLKIVGSVVAIATTAGIFKKPKEPKS